MAGKKQQYAEICWDVCLYLRQITTQRFQTNPGIVSQEIRVVEIADWACGTMICCRHGNEVKWPKTPHFAGQIQHSRRHLMHQPKLSVWKACWHGRIRGGFSAPQDLWDLHFNPPKYVDLTWFNHIEFGTWPFKTRILWLINRNRDAAAKKHLLQFIAWFYWLVARDCRNSLSVLAVRMVK